MLTNPFPNQGQQLVEHASINSSPSSSGGHAPSSQGGSASTTNIFICEHDVSLQTRAQSYEPADITQKGKEKNIPETQGPLHIERPVIDLVSCPPKGVMKRTVHNPNPRVAQNYNIVEDLAQAPCAMSTLEVLQSCPPQQKALLDSLGAVDPADTNIIHFELAYSTPRLHHRIAFQIQV